MRYKNVFTTYLTYMKDWCMNLLFDFYAWLLISYECVLKARRGVIQQTLSHVMLDQCLVFSVDYIQVPFSILKSV